MSLNSGQNYTAKLYDQTAPGAWVSLLCEGYKLEGEFLLSDIADFIRKTRSTHPDHILFATLDDERQAAYTCGHASDTHDLDNTEGHDLSSLPRAAFEDDDRTEHMGYLSLPEEFPIRHSNFMKKASGTTLGGMDGEIYWHEEAYGLPLLTRDTLNPEQSETQSFVQIVPVKTAAEALAAYPNGYFSSDFTPFQNYALAQHISQTFKFDLFGVGASYLGFMAEEALTADAAQALAQFLVRFFNAYEGDKPLTELLTETLTHQREFYLRYSS